MADLTNKDSAYRLEEEKTLTLIEDICHDYILVADKPLPQGGQVESIRHCCKKLKCS